MTNPGHASHKGEVNAMEKIIRSIDTETEKSIFGFKTIIDMRLLSVDASNAQFYGASLDGGDVLITGIVIISSSVHDSSSSTVLVVM